jgi:ubiquitin-conjugating enzyme E2 Q
LGILAKALNAGQHVQTQDQDGDDGEAEGEGEEDGEENYDAYYDEMDDFGPSAAGIQNLDLMVLQRLGDRSLPHLLIANLAPSSDFIEVVATSYRPGLIRFGADDFAISISLPIVTLASSIPPRALNAWDRRLLSRTQHLTLLIIGWRGTYPILCKDGTIGNAAIRNGSALTFKVGLTKRYKPGKEQAAEAGRTFGLVGNDAEDASLQQQQQQQQQLLEDQLDDPFIPEYPSPTNAKGKGKESDNNHEESFEEDPGSFEKFSLSSSLESLLDTALIKVIQLRKKFGLGWAGAELLLAEVEKSQKTPEDVYGSQRKVNALPSLSSFTSSSFFFLFP